MDKKEEIKQILYMWGDAEKICKEKYERVFELKKICVETEDITEKNNFSAEEVYKKTIYRLEKDIDEILNLKAKVDSFLSFLNREEQRIITLRYKDGLSWDYIPNIIHKSRMQCFRIHNKVIGKWWNEKIFKNI